jgi:hypothetical protein
MSTTFAPWLVLALLGVYHGVNPAMGWLFAVALGLQERSRRAVLRSLVPIALGHEAAIGIVVLLVSGAALVAAPQVLRIGGAVVLVGFGLFKLLRPRAHPRWVGMRVTLPELALWSFLMSSAHGAGLMLWPVLLRLPPPAGAGADLGPYGHDILASGLAVASLAQGVLAVLVHTLAMLLAMGAVALLVYDHLGLSFLRRAWLNLDKVWAFVVILAGVGTLFT